MKLFPDDASAVGHYVDALFYLALTLTGIAFVLVVGILIFFAIRYRAKKGERPITPTATAGKPFC